MKKNKFDKFENKVKQLFKYLETEFFYSFEGGCKKNFHYPMDAIVTVCYIGELGVLINWHIGENWISVDLCELEDGKIPKKISFYGNEGYAKAITLDSYIEYKTNGKVISPLPEISEDMSVNEMSIRAEKRKEILESDFDSILELYSNRLKEYAKDILNGNTDDFQQIIDYHTTKWNYKRFSNVK